MKGKRIHKLEEMERRLLSLAAELSNALAAEDWSAAEITTQQIELLAKRAAWAREHGDGYK